MPLSGMYNKSGGKVRLTFKLEQDQLWIGTKGTRSLAAPGAASRARLCSSCRGFPLLCLPPASHFAPDARLLRGPSPSSFPVCVRAVHHRLEPETRDPSRVAWGAGLVHR